MASGKSRRDFSSVQRRSALALPAPGEPRLAFFVREAWPSSVYGATLTEGLLGADDELGVTSGLDEDGVVFGDGIEADRLDFRWGVTARVRVARERLRLVTSVA